MIEFCDADGGYPGIKRPAWAQDDGCSDADKAASRQAEIDERTHLILEAVRRNDDVPLIPMIPGQSPWTTSSIMLDGAPTQARAMFLEALSAAFADDAPRAVLLLRKAGALAAGSFAEDSM